MELSMSGIGINFVGFFTYNPIETTFFQANKQFDSY
jgi:hypothetical protein